MPAWLLSIIVNIVLKFGIPALIEWLKKRWGISVTSEQVEKIVLEHQAKTRILKHETKQKLKECSGVACEMDTKSPY